MNNMSKVDKRIILGEKIRIDFSSIIPPEDDKIVENQSWAEVDLERSLVVKTFKGKDWKDISAKDIVETENTALHFFTNESFNFFLPAYMNTIIFNHEELDNSIAVDVLINKLIPPKTLLLKNNNYSDDELSRKKRFEGLQKLTLQQQKCVKLFLEFMDNEYSSDFFDEDDNFGEIGESSYILPSPSLALERYWAYV